MAPKLPENEQIITTQEISYKKSGYQRKIVWRNVILFLYLHLASIYGFYLFFQAKYQSYLFCMLLHHLSALGITAGAHRLWTHRCYKAKLPLRIFLAFCNTVAFQNHVIEWSRDHRVHHKFSETDADPHNATRGFFFAHMGWLLVRKHPELKRKGKEVDMSDLENDPVLAFQKKYYIPLIIFICFICPTIIPMYFWNETFLVSWYSVTLFRYCFQLHSTWLVNSAAHLWGQKPYDESINPAENLGVSLFTAGEGWHNYHHVFPWDYKAAELGNYRANPTTAFIDLMSKIGQAYDLKYVPLNVINNRCQRTGDGSRPLWGWGDKDMRPEDSKTTVLLAN